jgi:hypothetical protein
LFRSPVQSLTYSMCMLLHANHCYFPENNSPGRRLKSVNIPITQR